MIQNTNTLREDFEMLSDHHSIDSLEQVRVEPRLVTDPLICKMATDGNIDSTYKRMVETFSEGVDLDKLAHDHPLRDYGNEYTHLALLDTEGGQLITVHGDCIVPPSTCRKGLLDTLHGPDHSQFTKMHLEAKCHYFWPTLKQDCKVWSQKCQDCQDLQPKNSVTKFNMEQENIVNLEPMDMLGVDPFDIGTKAYLAITDKSNSFIKCFLIKDKTFSSVRKALVEFFLNFGRPHTIRSDSGPCFLLQFKNWVAEMGILLETNSSSKTEVNPSLIQFHWESYGYGAAAIVLGILLFGILIILFYFIKNWCCKVAAVRPRAEFGYTPWLPMGHLGTNLGQIGELPYSSTAREIPDPETTSQQLAISSALSRLHNECIARLQHFP